jgi:uncharacterized protein (UPF0332 family)
MESEFFNKAAYNLKAAQMCFDSGFYDACANRAYYAALQAAVVALEHNGIARDKIDHRWVQSEFSSKLIGSRKIYPTRLKSYLPEMQAVRNLADYKPEGINRKKASEQMSRASEMLMLIEKELSK